MPEQLHILRTGHIAMPERFIRLGGSSEDAVIPVLSFLAVGKDTLTLIDTGCAPAVATDPTEAWGKLARTYRAQIGPDELVDAQVRKAGFDIGDVTDVVLTHLHMDHVGGLQLIPHRPRIWMQRGEHRWGVSPEPHFAGGYFRHEYDLPDLDIHLVDGDSVIADGIAVLATHGHTPGHQSVVVQLPSGPVCIVGDAVYNRQLLDRRSLPAIASSPSQYLSAVSRLGTLETFFHTRLLFSHDAAQADELPDVLS